MIVVITKSNTNIFKLSNTKKFKASPKCVVEEMPNTE